MRKHAVLAVIGFVISGCFIFLFVRGLGDKWAELWEALRTANYWFIAIAIAIGLAGYVIKTLRWQLILAPIAVLPARRLFSAIMIGFMANCVLPARVGELIRAGVIGLKTEVSTSAAFATIVLERIFDSLTVLLFFIMVIIAYPRLTGGQSAVPEWVLKGGYVFMAIAAIGIVGLVILRLYPVRAIRLASKAFVFLPDLLREKLIGMLESFAEGLQVIRSWRTLLAVAALSIIHWIVMASIMYVASLCFGGTLPMGYFQSYVVFVYTALAVALPQAPGFVGTFWFAASYAITDLHLALPEGVSEQAVASAYAWLLWAASVFPVILVGFACLWAEGLSLREVRRKGEEIEEAKKHGETEGGP